MKEYGIIYKATNVLTGKCYIGQTVRELDERKRQHIYDKRCKNYFSKAIRKYGIDNFKWEVIDSVNSQDELNEKEIYYINHFNTLNHQHGYNLRTGGLGGGKHSEETKLKFKERIFTEDMKNKMSEKAKLRCSNPEEILRLKEIRKGKVPWIKGKIHTEETRLKISKALKGKSSWNKGTKGIMIAWNKGKTGVYSAEHIEKMRESHKGQISYWKGKQRSEETKLKISESLKGHSPWMKGKHHSEETKRKISDNNWMKGKQSPFKGILRPQNNGENNSTHKLTESQVRRIKWIAKYCNPPKGYWTKIANSLNVSISSISMITKNRVWKWVEV